MYRAPIASNFLHSMHVYSYKLKDGEGHARKKKNLCTEGMCVYKTEVLIVELYLQDVNFLPRLHTDWFKYRVNQQSCVMCCILLPSLCSSPEYGY